MFCFVFCFYTLKKEDIAVCVFKYVRACVLDSRGEERENGFVCCRSVLVTYNKFVAVMATLF